MKFTLGDMAKATGGRLIGSHPGPECCGVSIDSRTIAPGQLFVAIEGPHFDGHDFVAQALAQGAKGLVVRRGVPVPNGAHAIEVADTVRALGDMAAWWRSRFSVPCVAITGSNGKSTTKEMAAAVVGGLGSVLKTEGNFNNLIGLPLTVFRWEERHKVAILEMGMNAPGEIRRLAEISRPSVGLVTNVTAAHLEKLHTVEAVARAKCELFEAMGKEGIVIVNDEDPWVRKMAEIHPGPKITFGMQNNSDVRFLHMETHDLDSMELMLSVNGREVGARLLVPGVHNVMNALASVAVGVALGVDPAQAVKRLVEFRPMALRFERVQLANGTRVVDDSYNANPGSVEVAFRTVGSAKRAGRFIAALGDMLELGQASSQLHHDVGMSAGRMGVDRLYLVGQFARDLAEGALAGGMDPATVMVCPNVDGLCSLLESELRTGDVLLVKGSRATRMERVVWHLKRTFGTG
jgi:UDP-N-acetylmuramoyl-tripeptide--D-alanyl-D-alanine ligase